MAPLAALGCELPKCVVDGSAVALQAYLGAGATSTGFAGTWRGDAVIIKMYHASAAPEVAALEPTALLAAADVSGLCQLRGAGDGFLLLAPFGVVAYSLRADPAAAPPARASPAGLWSPARAAAEPPALPAVASDPARPGAAEFCDLVDALAGLHAVGWVHRDPRPANFFRDRRALLPGGPGLRGARRRRRRGRRRAPGGAAVRAAGRAARRRRGWCAAASA